MGGKEKRGTISYPIVWERAHSLTVNVCILLAGRGGSANNRRGETLRTT